MSIASELNRLLQAKSDLATSIANKGVTVPAATTIDGYAALVDQIGVSYDSQVEYLQSTGTQYIDTGVVPTATIGLSVHVQVTQSGDHYFCGLRDTTGNTRWCIGYNNNYYYGYTGSGGISTTSKTSRDILNLNFENNKKFMLNIGGSIYTYSLPSLEFTPVHNIRLFGAAGVSASYMVGYIKLYSCLISDGYNIIMDLIPVRVGQVGYMYDRVSRRLLGNNGTGSFTLGPDVT